MTPNEHKEDMEGVNEEVAETWHGLQRTLHFITTNKVAEAGNWRVEYDDLLGEVKIGAWRGLVKAYADGKRGLHLRRYAIKAARHQAAYAMRDDLGDPLHKSREFGDLGEPGGHYVSEEDTEQLTPGEKDEIGLDILD